MVTITEEEHEKLLEDAKLLECLRRAGVDNWEGWDDAIDFFEGE